MINPPFDVDSKCRLAEAACASVGETVYDMYGCKEQTAVGKYLVGIGKKEMCMFIKQFGIYCLLLASCLNFFVGIEMGQCCSLKEFQGRKSDHGFCALYKI